MITASTVWAYEFSRLLIRWQFHRQAINDEGGDVNKAYDHDHRKFGTIPEIAKAFKARRQPWALIVDENYGEGSAREHAALQPRFYGKGRS